MVCNQLHNGPSKKVMIALSGGVDSSTSAALLIKQNYSCQAVFMITHDYAEKAEADARKVADKLNIKLHILDCREQFTDILRYFTDEYKKGRTPNPCVYCNRNIKFDLLLEFARQHNCDYLATGHYAQVKKTDSGLGLFSAVNPAKDQSYALAMIDRKVLDHVMLPVGSYTKEQIRELAKNFELDIADKPDSQEICFIPDNDYVAAIEKLCPELIRSGEVVDIEGNKLGTHNGIHQFTIGQRRGLKIAMGEPYYVVDIDAENNRIVLGQKAQLMKSKLIALNTNWLVEPKQQPFEAVAKIRYNHRPRAARITPVDKKIVVHFYEPIGSITPGQAVVLYRQSDNAQQVLAGAWIEKAE